MTPASSIAAAQDQCRSTQSGMSASDIPLRRQIFSAISRASGSMLEDFMGLSSTNRFVCRRLYRKTWPTTGQSARQDQPDRALVGSRATGRGALAAGLPLERMAVIAELPSASTAADAS